MSKIMFNGNEYSDTEKGGLFYDFLNSRGEGIPENSDLNDYTTPGKYYVSGSSTAATIQNAPSYVGSTYSLYVMQYGGSGNTRLQIAIFSGNSSAFLWYRKYNASSEVWTNWYSVAGTADS